MFHTNDSKVVLAVLKQNPSIQHCWLANEMQVWSVVTWQSRQYQAGLRDGKPAQNMQLYYGTAKVINIIEYKLVLRLFMIFWSCYLQILRNRTTASQKQPHSVRLYWRNATVMTIGTEPVVWLAWQLMTALHSSMSSTLLQRVIRLAIKNVFQKVRSPGLAQCVPTALGSFPQKWNE